jgi:predicted phage terminase large subunit-like protein
MPRGSLKSEIVESYMIQRILQDPNIRILYILESKQKAIDYLKGLKDHLESEKFQAIYGDIRDLSVWREDCIRVKGRTVNAKEHTVFCGSLESSTGLTGKHPTLIVADDLHSLLNTRTEHQVGSAKEVFTELVNLGMDGARQIVVGTYWVNNDIYNTITRSVTDKPFSEIHKVRLLENDYWSIYVRSAIEPCENGETLEIPGFGVFENSKVSFPKVGLKLLIEKWSQPTMTRYVFSCQQLCNPEESMNSEFSKEELDDATGVDWERVKDKKLVRSMLLLDPAYSTSCSSDYSAFTYCGYTDDGTLKIELSLREKVEPDKLVEQVFAMRMAYRPHIVGIESNSTQILGKWIKDKRAEKGQYFKIVEIKTPHNSKILRIRALKALFKTHKIAINPECIDLLNEFKEFPTSKKDDLIDCVSFVLNEALHNPNYQDKPVVRPKSGPWKSLPGYKPIGS